MRDLERFKAWERSRRSIVALHKATVSSAREKSYGLESQRRHSCAALPANIAEGWHRAGSQAAKRGFAVAQRHRACAEEALSTNGQSPALEKRDGA
jgi:four helix bundle protein